MISASLIRPGVMADADPDAVVDAHIETRRLGAGEVSHTLLLEGKRSGSGPWRKEITFAVEAPFEVPDLATDDPFLVASLFPAMEQGGTLRFHGRASRMLIRNVLDYQSAWFRAAPDYCQLFNLEVDEVDDQAPVDPGANPKSVLAFTGGMDSFLALCRNTSGDAGPTAHDIRATLAIHGMGIGQKQIDGTAALLDDLRMISAEWDLPMAVVRTNMPNVVGTGSISHGTWLATSLSLFAGRFDVGLLGSSVVLFWPGWELFGSHPLLDPLLSGRQMAIRNDEGLFHRVDKAALLARHPKALEHLRVCVHPYRGMQNCCRCEKCLRTMLCFIASGNPVPPAFPDGLRLGDIGIGMGNADGLDWGPVILQGAERYGAADAEAIRVLRKRYRTKRMKVAAKAWLKRLRGGKAPNRWRMLDGM